MSGIQPQPTVRDELLSEYRQLDAGCRRYGVTAHMFRTVKYLFYMVVLAFSAYLIQYAAVEPFIAMAFAALLITGPEGLEQWLIKTGQLEAGTEGDTKNDS